MTDDRCNDEETCCCCEAPAKFQAGCSLTCGRHLAMMVQQEAALAGGQCIVYVKGDANAN